MILAATLLLAAHTITLDDPVLVPEEGLLFGNGDLSCSVYQAADEIVFRFGKGDVWDRRLDFSKREKNPITHDELVRGLLDEGWVCSNYYEKGRAVATKGTKNAARMHEVMELSNPTLNFFPYPCPKPTGEFRLRYPCDIPGPAKLRQQISVEEGLYSFSLRWKNGEQLDAEAAIAPDANVFSLKWKFTGFDLKMRHRWSHSPLAFTLLRLNDSDPVQANGNFQIAWTQDWFGRNWMHGEATPLAVPRAWRIGEDGRHAIEQEFPAEPTFPDGFRCRMTLTPKKGEWVFGKGNAKDHLPGAYLCYRPKKDQFEGDVQITVTTSCDKSLDAPLPPSHDAIAAAARVAAQKAWAQSGVSFPDDPFLENLWYSVYHVRRSVLRGGTVPPGLFLPSTVGDYSNWHGDYHSNYNYQSIYWGGFAANRLDEMLACIDCTEFFRDTGHLRAQKYYGMRGSFVPLEAFPLKASDDYSTHVPLGRMVYMTGWAAVPYWQYYLYTLDREFLERRGYPAIKDFALFFLDFLKKAPSKDLPPDLDDGLYHAFPSIEEETAVKSLKDVTDRPQVLAFTRYALYAAVEASKVLNVDAELRAEWQDRLDNLFGPGRTLKGYERHCFFANPPDFGYSTPPPKPAPEWTGKKREINYNETFGHSIRWRIARVRNGEFIPGRDFDEYRESLMRWTHPNGQPWGMNIDVWGRLGGWTESLSALAPLQEMMLQSWDGAINLFPRWPKERNAAFWKFRAQGAFLVSSEWKDGRLGKTEIFSEKGARCSLHGNWRVTTADGRPVATSRDEFDRFCFQTVPGAHYTLIAADKG